MIFGSGIDIAKVSRFKKWIESPGMTELFFNPAEIKERPAVMTAAQESALAQHYAARFAAKEAFSKAIGTGLAFDLRDAFVQNEENGRPRLVIQNSALELFKKACPAWKSAAIFVSLSHEKEFAVAQVIVEILEE